MKNLIDEDIRRIEKLIKRKEMGDYMIPFLLGCEFMVLILIFLVVWV